LDGADRPISIRHSDPTNSEAIYYKLIESNQIYLLKTHHISKQQVVKAVDEQGQQGSKVRLQ